MMTATRKILNAKKTVILAMLSGYTIQEYEKKFFSVTSAVVFSFLSHLRDARRLS